MILNLNLPKFEVCLPIEPLPIKLRIRDLRYLDAITLTITMMIEQRALEEPSQPRTLFLAQQNRPP